MSKKTLRYKDPAVLAYMNQVREMDQHIQQLRNRSQNMRRLLTDTSVHLSDMPRSTSPDLQRHQTIQAEVDQLEREISEAEAAAETLRLEVGSTICRVTDPLIQQVLLMHYLDGKSWSQIAGLIKYSKTQTYRFVREGLREIEMIL